MIYVQKNKFGDSIDLIETDLSENELNEGYQEGSNFWVQIPKGEVWKYYCKDCGGILLTANSSCCC